MDAALKLWQERVDIKGGLISGEPANASAPKKGIVEVKIINRNSRELASKNQQAMSRGFEIAIQELSRALIVSD
jgi:hypothetical protein